MSNKLPDCMMPGDGEPCMGYQQLEAELAELKLKREELRAAIAKLLGCGDTWPNHGNVELAIAASFALEQKRADKAEDELYCVTAERDEARNALANAELDEDSVKHAAEQLKELRAERDRLRKAYAEAIEYIEHLARYASEYFKEKHKLDDCVRRHRDILGE